jgi:hypothetical protein
MEKQMHFRLFLAAGIATAVVASPSFAAEVKLTGTHSEAAVGAACQAAGGRSWTTAPMGGGRYGCVNDKKGTSVTCTPGGECTGEVPDRQAAGGAMKNLVGVLSGLSIEPGKKASPPRPGILDGSTGFNANAPASTGKPKAQVIR